MLNYFCFHVIRKGYYLFCHAQDKDNILIFLFKVETDNPIITIMNKLEEELKIELGTVGTTYSQ